VPLFVGIMSGTSLDGADAALVDFSSTPPRTLAFASAPFDTPLRERLLELSQPGEDGVDLAGEVSLELAEVYAGVVRDALARGGVTSDQVTAIGCHGQTIRHRPERGFTVQLNDPARLAEFTGVDVVADFRRRDMAAGGQGAPLVPAFHDALFRDPRISRVVVNIGGISNVTWMPPSRPTTGFDCGPGNVLLDGWTREHRGTAFDEDGAWADTGTIDRQLLARLLAEPFLAMPPPKSTGRELFHSGWLKPHLDRKRRPEDVQATLADFTARAIVDAIDRYCATTDEIYLAGGGARNRSLVRRIAAIAGGRSVDTTDKLGVPTGHVESMAFAWLAMKCIRREAVDLAAVTGAKGPRILGAIYPA
jgi:anhydro-N-acetylmuramic acid kinase